MFSQPFETWGGLLFGNGAKYGFKIIDDESGIQTFLDGYYDVKFFQLIENGGSLFVESSWKFIFRSIGTAALMALPISGVSEVSPTTFAVILLQVGGNIRHEAKVGVM